MIRKGFQARNTKKKSLLQVVQDNNIPKATFMSWMVDHKNILGSKLSGKKVCLREGGRQMSDPWRDNLLQFVKALWSEDGLVMTGLLVNYLMEEHMQWTQEYLATRHA